MLFARAELARSKVRFGLLTLGAGLLVFVLLFQQLLLGAVLDGMTGALQNQSAPVLVLAREARRAVSGSLVTPDQVTAVGEVDGVADAAELAVTMLSFKPEDGGVWTEATVFGFQPDRPGTPTRLTSGRLPEAPDEVVVSGEDAQGRFGVGDTLAIEPGDARLTVVGLTAGSRFNVSPTLWVRWPTYQMLAGMAAPGALVLPSVVAVQPEEGVDVDQVVANIDEAAPELEALTRSAAVKTAPGRSSVQIAFMVVMGLGYLVVAIVIGFFFLTLTLQKEPAITLMRAVGSPQKYLVRSLLLQVAVVTLGGLVLGGALVAIAIPLIRGSVPVTVKPSAIGLSAASAMGVALLGAISPIRRVMRADPYGVVSRPSLGGLG
jgi:putative ABC transport system permease protein